MLKLVTFSFLFLLASCSSSTESSDVVEYLSAGVYESFAFKELIIEDGNVRSISSDIQYRIYSDRSVSTQGFKSLKRDNESVSNGTLYWHCEKGTYSIINGIWNIEANCGGEQDNGLHPIKIENEIRNITPNSFELKLGPELRLYEKVSDVP